MSAKGPQRTSQTNFAYTRFTCNPGRSGWTHRSISRLNQLYLFGRWNQHEQIVVDALTNSGELWSTERRQDSWSRSIMAYDEHRATRMITHGCDDVFEVITAVNFVSLSTAAKSCARLIPAGLSGGLPGGPPSANSACRTSTSNAGRSLDGACAIDAAGLSTHVPKKITAIRLRIRCSSNQVQGSVQYFAARQEALLMPGLCPLWANSRHRDQCRW